MWQTLQKSYARDRDLPQRTSRIQALQRVLGGTIYANLRYAFHEETNGANEYIKLRDRRPSVRYNLCKLVVQQSTAMLFSEGHFPEAAHDDEATRDTLNDIIRDARINEVMIDAAEKGSVGSVCLWLRILEGRIYVSALTTEYLTPTYNPMRPDDLMSVREQYKLRGRALRDMGYAIKDADLDAMHWWTRDWTDQAEIWYLPVKISREKPGLPESLAQDNERTIQHNLGFVPMVWIRNLPGGDDIDGAPTFGDEAIETNIEIEYMLSQAGRGLKYASDPLLMIKEPAVDPGRQMVRSASNAIIVSKDGDAKLVEIDGAATSAVLEYVRTLREFTLEQLNGNRANADKLSAAQSGRAMELLNQALIWLADKLRISYGEYGLKKLLQMIVRASAKMALVDSDGDPIPRMAPGRIALKWPPWYAPTSQDRSSDANTLRTLTDAGLMSTETAVGTLAPVYDVEDVPSELARITAEQAERNAQAQEQVRIME
jgi:hypothetical protein